MDVKLFTPARERAGTLEQAPAAAFGARLRVQDSRFSQSSTRSIPPRFALATYSAIQSGPSMCLAISTTI